MGGIDAAAIATKMVEMKSAGNRADKFLVHCPVGRLAEYPAVPFFVERAHPVPTARDGIYYVLIRITGVVVAAYEVELLAFLDALFCVRLRRDWGRMPTPAGAEFDYLKGRQRRCLYVVALDKRERLTLHLPMGGSHRFGDWGFLPATASAKPVTLKVWRITPTGDSALMPVYEKLRLALYPSRITIRDWGNRGRLATSTVAQTGDGVSAREDAGRVCLIHAPPRF